MFVIFIIAYIICTFVILYHTYNITNNKNKKYIEKIHLHLSSIIFYHIVIVCIFIYLSPSCMNDIRFSSINVLCAIMFSILLYYTNETDYLMKYVYCILYVIPVSITMAELFLYHKNKDACAAMFTLLFFIIL